MPTTGVPRRRMRACAWFVSSQTHRGTDLKLSFVGPTGTKHEDTTLSGNGEIHHPMTQGHIPNERKHQLPHCENLEH